MENALWSEFWYDLERQFDPDASPKELLQSSGELFASTPKASISKSESCTTNKTTNTQQAGYVLKTPTTFAEFAEACSRHCLSNKPKPQRNPENTKHKKASGDAKALSTSADILKPRNRQNRTKEKAGKREKTKRRIKMSHSIDANGQCADKQGVTKLVPKREKSPELKQIKRKNLNRNQSKRKRIPNPKQNVKKTANENQNSSRKRKCGRSKRKLASTSVQPTNCQHPNYTMRKKWKKKHSVRRAVSFRQKVVNAILEKNTRERCRRGALRESLQELESVLVSNGFLDLYNRKTYKKMSTKDVILVQSIEGLRSMLTELKTLRNENDKCQSWLRRHTCR